jgi:hypothetical protein
MRPESTDNVTPARENAFSGEFDALPVVGFSSSRLSEDASADRC